MDRYAKWDSTYMRWNWNSIESEKIRRLGKFEKNSKKTVFKCFDFFEFSNVQFNFIQSSLNLTRGEIDASWDWRELRFSLSHQRELSLFDIYTFFMTPIRTLKALYVIWHISVITDGMTHTYALRSMRSLQHGSFNRTQHRTNVPLVINHPINLQSFNGFFFDFTGFL